jgi:SHS2 domain-containing protein
MGLLPYEILDHTADTVIEARASSFPALIDELATGMFALIAIVEPCPKEELVEVEVTAPTTEDLVVEVLSELLYEADVEDLVLCGFKSRIVAGGGVRVTARGAPTAGLDMIGPPIKAVTYHDVVAERTDAGWFGRVYFDV